MLMSRAEWRRNARLSDNKTMDCLLNKSINAKALWFECQLVVCGSCRGSLIETLSPRDSPLAGKECDPYGCHSASRAIFIFRVAYNHHLHNLRLVSAFKVSFNQLDSASPASNAETLPLWPATIYHSSIAVYDTGCKSKLYPRIC